MTDVFLTTTGTLSPVVISDLGGAEFVHPVTNLLLTEEFSLDDIQASLEIGNGLANEIAAGTIVVTDELGNALIAGDDAGNVDTTGIETGEWLYWDGSNFSRTTNLTYNPGLGNTLQSVSEVRSKWGIFCFNNDPFTTSDLYIGKARGTIDTPLALLNEDLLGVVGFKAYNGVGNFPTESNEKSVALITGYATEDHTVTNAGARLSFWATPNGQLFPQRLVDFSAAAVRFINYPNTVDNGSSPTALYTDASGNMQHGLIVPAEGYVESDDAGDNTQNLNTVASSKVSFSGTNFSNSSQVVWNAANNSWDVNFTGQVCLEFSLNITSGGARNSISGTIVRERSGIFLAKVCDTSYIRDNSGHIQDGLHGKQYFDCIPGDQFHVDTFRAANNQADTNMFGVCNFNIRRIS